MYKPRRILLPLSAAVILTARAAAQNTPTPVAPLPADPPSTFSSLGSYALAVPIGDTRRFAGAPSWMGFTWDGEWAKSAHTGLGVDLGVNDFLNRSHGTTDFPTGAVTGEQMRDLLAISLSGNGRWYARGASRLGPYVGLGVGALYVEQNYQVGLTSQIERSGLHLLVTPEAGFAIPVFDGVNAVTSLRYAAPGSAGPYIGGGSRRFQFVTLTIGIVER